MWLKIRIARRIAIVELFYITVPSILSPRSISILSVDTHNWRARSSLFALLLISPMLPTGSKYAYLYLEGKFLTIGEAAAKQEVYEPGSGRMKNNSITMPASTGQGVRSAKVLISPGWIGMERIGMLRRSSFLWSSRANRTHASLVTPGQLSHTLVWADSRTWITCSIETSLGKSLKQIRD